MRVRPRLPGYLPAALLACLALSLVPGPAAADQAASQLRREMAGLLAHSALRGARVGAYVVSLPEGEVLYSLNPRLAFVPASTMKLVVSATALRLLGADFVYDTSVWGLATPVGGGVMPGDLVVTGTADPTARASLYDDLARRLKAQGLTRVKGNIVGVGVVAAGERQDGGLSAARALHAALGRKGISVTGQAVAGQMIPSAHLLSRQPSTTLRAYLRTVNLQSDNDRAELLLRSLTSIFGRPGDASHGFVRELWQEANVDVSGLELVEGSGLSHQDKLTPRFLAEMLVAMVAEERQLQALVESLPVAGAQGTLADRMRDTVAAGRVYAKTGTLLKASGLAGYVRVRGQTRLAFALMMNDYSCSVTKVRNIQDLAAIAMTRYALSRPPMTSGANGALAVR